MVVALLKYFKRIETSKEEKIESILPEPDSPLKHSMLSSVTEATNSAVPVKSLTKSSINEVFVCVVFTNNRVHISNM